MRRSSGKILLMMRDPRRKGKSVEGIYAGFANDLKNTLNIEVYHYNDGAGILSNIWAIRKQRPAVVHVASDMYHLLPFLFGTKRVMTIHDIGRFKELRGINRFVYKWLLLKLPALCADAIVVVSEYTKSDVLKYVGSQFASKISLIYNPVSALFRYKPKQFNSTIPVILQIGTGRNKNLERIILALRTIPSELVIVGELSEQQRSMLNENVIGYSQFVDLKPEEVYQKYVECDIVSFVSLQEGFGMPIIEANATGRPVICSNVCSLPEIAGASAFFVKDETSVREIREKFDKLISDETLRRKLVEKGLENIKRFERLQINAKLLKLYQRLLS